MKSATYKALIERARADLLAEAAQVVAHARAQALLAELRPQVAEAEAEARAQAEAKARARTGAGEAKARWDALRFREDQQAAHQDIANARGAWQEALADADRLAGQARQAGAQLADLAALKAELESIEEPALDALVILAGALAAL